MYFSAKNRINILLSAVPIRAWRLAYKERIGIDDRGYRPLRKIHLLAYVRQDANVATGECRRQADVRSTTFFESRKSKVERQKALPRRVRLFDCFVLRCSSADGPVMVVSIDRTITGSSYGNDLTATGERGFQCKF